MCMLGAVAYFTLSLARNVLGVVAVQMKNDGFVEGFFGTASSVYFICYAFGQLINGFLGERVKSVYMISIGLLGGAISNFIFSLAVYTEMIAFVAYGCTGFFLSMIYAPLTKVLAENNPPIYATRCCLGMQMGSLLGAPAAGVLASFVTWRNSFNVSNILLVAVSVICFFCFISLEKRGAVVYKKYTPCNDRSKRNNNFGLLLKTGIVKMSIVRIVTNIVGTTLMFWVSIYMVDYLGVSSKISPAIYSVLTVVVSLAPFLSVFAYERLKQNLDLTMGASFVVSTFCLVASFFIKQPTINILLVALAILTSQMGASLTATVYCMGLRDLGVVSSVTGYLDFVAYMSSAISSAVFANAVTDIGWKNLILVWAGCMLVGTLSVVFGAVKRKI